VTVVPWRRRIRVNPESPPRRSRLAFGISVYLAILGALFRLIILVVPGHPGLDLLKTNVMSIEQDFSDYSVIFISLGPFNSDLFTED